MIDCPCEICGEADIRLNCPEVMNGILPAPLRSMFAFSQECMGIGAITKFFTNSGSEKPKPILPLISPILTSMKPVPERVVGTTERWYLVNADTNQFLEYLVDGQVIDLQEYPTRNFNLCIETRGDVASVDLSLNTLSNVDNAPPYCMASDDPLRGTFSHLPHLHVEGHYVLRATPYLFDDLKGRPGNTTGITLSIVDSSLPATDTSVGRILRWNLLNTETGQHVRKLSPSDLIHQRSFGTQLTVCVDARVTVGSVMFLINGAPVHFDNTRPFCLSPDDARAHKYTASPALTKKGGYMIAAVPYGGTQQSGPVGTTESIALTILE